MEFLRKFYLSVIPVVCFEVLFLISSPLKNKFPAENGDRFPALSLVGVVVSDNPSSSVAVLQNEGSDEVIFLRTGEKISDLILTHVFENRIVLETEENTVQIFLGRNNLAGLQGKKQNYSRKREFSRAEMIERAVRDWPSIVREAKLVHNYTDGRIDGFKITQLPKLNIFSEIGIRENDIVKEINGIQLNGTNTPFSLFDKFKNQNRFEVIIERNKEPVRLVYILK